MAAKEKKSAVTKHLKDCQPDKERIGETPKSKRGRKPNTPPSDNKLNSEEKVGKRKKRKNVEDSQSPSVQKRARRLEKELEDLLENAVGRSTPSLTRNKKINEKEEENGDGTDDKSVLFLTKAKRMSEKEAEDDNLSVKSFSTLLRTRKFAEKEVDDDQLSVKSLNVRSRKNETIEDDAASVRSLNRQNLVGKPGRKKKSVLTAIAVKKKIFIRRGRPKKTKEIIDTKTKHLEDKRVARIKVVDKNVVESKQKRVIKKPLKFQNKIKDRPALAIKNQKLKKAKLKLSEKNQGGRQTSKGEGEVFKDNGAEQPHKERLKTDSQTVALTKSEASDLMKNVASDLASDKKKCVVVRKRKMLKRDCAAVDGGERTGDGYFIPEGEASRGKVGKMVKLSQPKGKGAKKKSPEERRKRRESGIHFETTRSPDDSSVIIVQPRLGPKSAKRLKPILPKTDEVGKRTKSLPKEMVPTNVLPNSLSTTMPNFSQISNSYLLQSIPNFNVFAANSALLRSLNSNAAVSANFDASADLPYVEDSEYTFSSKMSPNEIIVTPSGIVLSGGRIVSPGSQNPPAVCFNGSASNFVSEAPKKDVVYSSREALESVPSSGLKYQNSATVIQPSPCPNTKTALFLKRPETMSTSLISTSAGALLINSNVNANGGLRVGSVKSHSTDTIASEKALEGDFQAPGETPAPNRFKNVSKIDLIPSIPVAKNVNDLILLKEKTNIEKQVVEKAPTANGSGSCSNFPEKSTDGISKMSQIKTNTVSVGCESKLDKSRGRMLRKRTLRNVRQVRGSSSELTFSEPELSSCDDKDDVAFFKTISCEQINKRAPILESNPNVLLQLGSEPIAFSESLVPFETASMLLVARREKLEEKLEKEGDPTKGYSPKVKGAIDVCRFSKENEEALKELGLDSDLDQTKSEIDGDSPHKMGKMDDENDSMENTNKAKIKEEVDNILKEMPIRRISNFCKQSEAFKSSTNRVEFKAPFIHKNGDYLTVSPSKPPTVIDKLLERNKSLKKAEQEGRFQNAVRNLSENSLNYEGGEIKSKRNSRETKTRKFSRGMDSKKVPHKRFIHSSSGGKIYERRGSNPEIYSHNYLSVKNQVANENVPLRRLPDSGDDKFPPRRGSIDYESLQKVLDRRCSLPSHVENLSDPQTLDVNKVKTENIKTIVVGSGKPLTSKNRASETQPRVINIVTSNCGMKKGKNLMEEVGLELASAEKNFVNGEKCRRVSLESSNSESDNLQKLMDGLTDINAEEKLSHKVPYFGDESSKKIEKIRVSLDRKPLEEDEKKRSIVIEESPEDLVTKETILSALGLQSLKAAAQNAKKKREAQNHNSICQADNGGYTGTLKTVIKIQRQEKKGSSKSPIKMVYKASSSSSASGHLDENNYDDAEATSVEDAEENTSEDNKGGNGKAKSLVIPEKASSFSIHPGRMCSDVCTYCFGKFGLLDTPCHIAQLKDADKRRNILATEVHLTADSCLCDACFRHVDKKSNCPSFTDKKNDIRRRGVRKQSCIVQNCNAESQHSIRRKLFLKLKKSIGRKVVLDAGKLEKVQPGQSLTFCNRHIYWIDYFMSCGICKKRLTSVNMYRVTSEVLELNAALSSDEIPAILTENRFLCKICNCFASIRIKCKDPNEMSSSHRQFYETCRKRILKCHGMDVPDSEPEGDCKNGSERKGLRRSKKSSKPTATVTNENSKSDNDVEMSMEEMDKTNESEKSEKDLKEVSHMNIPPKANGNLDFGGVSITPTTTEVNPTQIHVKLGNLNIGALGNLNIGQDVRHGTRTGDIQCFPTETELALRAHFDLKPSAEDESAKTPRKGFEKCTTTIQFSAETKNLFYNLQMPYGNQSSFFRHLILLEKYFRSGDLVISRNADPKAINYISSVQNRIRSYEGVHSPVKKPQEIPPSLSILPQPIKTESRSGQEAKAGVLPSRPFTLTPMPSNSYSNFLKNSPLSQIQATVQNIQPVIQSQSQGVMTSLLKSSLQTSSKYATHPKPEVSITSVTNDGSPPVRVGQVGKASVLTKKIQENLRNLASKSQAKQSNQARAVILNRTVGGQKQSLVQVTTGGRTIHLTLSQFRRIQQMQMKKKQYLEHQAKMLKGKEDQGKGKGKTSEDSFNLKNISPELEIQEVKTKPNDSEIFPLISEVRSLAGEETSWDQKGGESSETSHSDSFPKIPKTLSVSVTKIPVPDYTVKEQSVESVE